MDTRAIEWARCVDWARVGTVVVVGDLSDVTTIAAEVKPAAEVVQITPDPDGTLDLVELSAAISIRRWPQARVELAIEPALRERWERLVVDAIEQGCGLAEQRHETEALNARRWCEATLAVVPQLHELVPITALNGCAQEATGVVVGSGPSLDIELDALFEIRNEALIIACQTSLPALESYGIHPHIIVAVEANPLAYDGLKGLKLWSDAIFAPGLHAFSGAYELGARAIAPVPTAAGQTAKWLLRHLGIEPVRSGGSVATVAYELLLLLGCDTIVAVGVDCTTAYAPYAAGVRPYIVDERWTTPVPGWGRGADPISGHPIMNYYRRYLEDRCRANPEIRHINASRGGAHIEGWDDVRLASVIPRGKRPDREALFETLNDAPSLDWSWLGAAIERQSAGAQLAAERGKALVGSTQWLIGVVEQLATLGNAQGTDLVGGISIGPLEEWAAYPSVDALKALNKSGERLVESADVLRLLFAKLRKELYHGD